MSKARKSLFHSPKIISSSEETAFIKAQAAKFHVVISGNSIKAACPSIDDPIGRTQDVSLLLTTESSKDEVNIHNQFKKALETMCEYYKKDGAFKAKYLELDVRGIAMFINIVKKQDYIKDHVLSTIASYANSSLSVESYDTSCSFSGGGVKSPVTIGYIFNKLILPEISVYMELDIEVGYVPKFKEATSDKKQKDKEEYKEKEEDLSHIVLSESKSATITTTATASSTTTDSPITTLHGETVVEDIT